MMLCQWKIFVNHLGREEKGAGLVEYVLLIALIALFVIAAAIFFSGELAQKFSDIGDTIVTS